MKEEGVKEDLKKRSRGRRKLGINGCCAVLLWVIEHCP